MTLSRCTALLALLAVGCGGDERRDEERVRVPDLRGMGAVEARIALEAAGLEDADRRTDPRTVVVAQRPAAGEALERGARVSVERAMPLGVRALARGIATTAPIRRVRPTRDPRVVRVLIPPWPCFRIHARPTRIVGDVAFARILMRVPPARLRCGPPGFGHWVRVRFDEPVTDKAIVTDPIVRPIAAVDVRPTSWNSARVRPVSPDGRTLAVTWTSGASACWAFAGIEAVETPSSVRITVREGRPPGEVRNCTLIAVPKTALVRLREPLGNRAIVRSPDPVAVPDVRGMHVFEAQHLLAALGLRWSDGRTGMPETAPAGHGDADARQVVVGQAPRHGTRVPPGGVVALEQEAPVVDALAFPDFFRDVRPTRDPRVVELALESEPCHSPRVRTRVAGEIALVRLDLRGGFRGDVCTPDVPGSVRVRFDRPVRDRAILPMPVLRPRPVVGSSVEDIEEARVVSPDGRTIGVRWSGGMPPCQALASLEADEGPRTVRLTLRAGRPRGTDPHDTCFALALVSVAVVRLREPLGSRRLVDVVD